MHEAKPLATEDSLQTQKELEAIRANVCEFPSQVQQNNLHGNVGT